VVLEIAHESGTSRDAQDDGLSAHTDQLKLFLADLCWMERLQRLMRFVRSVAAGHLVAVEPSVHLARFVDFGSSLLVEDTFDREEQLGEQCVHVVTATIPWVARGSGHIPEWAQPKWAGHNPGALQMTEGVHSEVEESAEEDLAVGSEDSNANVRMAELAIALQLKAVPGHSAAIVRGELSLEVVRLDDFPAAKRSNLLEAATDGSAQSRVVLIYEKFVD
jgi:hypothetical protein